jgi:aspartate/tyrosine/aromatic aminotransferase
MWRADLKEARQILTRKRQIMLKMLPRQFEASLKGYGMFAMLPLTVDQVNRLKHEHKVFVLLDGRINIGGIPEARIAELCEKIQSVL